MSGQTELPRYSGAATIIRYAVYVHRGIIPAEDLHETFDGGSVLVTSSPERAIAEGLPPAAHRLSLILFAYLLTKVESDAAGRAYATYGGVYIVASILWLWLVEHRAPDRWDILGAGLCLVGAAVILFGPRTT